MPDLALAALFWGLFTGLLNVLFHLLVLLVVLLTVISLTHDILLISTQPGQPIWHRSVQCVRAQIEIH